MTAATPVDGELAVCGRCRRPIVWEPDDPTADDNPYGLWVDEVHGTEACTPGPNDEDHYHAPEEQP